MDLSSTTPKRSRESGDEGNVAKKPRLEQEAESANLFDDPDFNDYKLIVTAEGEATEPRVLHVTKLMLARSSALFLERIRANRESLQVTLKPGTRLDHFVDLIRWIYANNFQTPVDELLNVVVLAQEFKMEAAFEAAVSSLTSEMTLAKAAGLLLASQRLAATDASRGPSNLDELFDVAQRFLVSQFIDLEAALGSALAGEWAKLPVEAIKVVLESSELHVGSENSIFAAYRAWVHHDFAQRKHVAIQLLPHIRFPLLQRNYLMDVVRNEADLDYPDEAKKVFAKRLIECYIFHTSSDVRRETLGEPRPEQRRYDLALLTTRQQFTIEGVSQVREKWSDPFMIGGYVFCLLFQRKNPDHPDGGTIGVYMHIKPRESGLSTKFYLPLAFELRVRHRGSNKFVSPKGVYASPFTFQNRAWGYVDLLGMKWNDFLKPNCYYRDNDVIVFNAQVGLADPAPRTPPVSSTSSNTSPQHTSAQGGNANANLAPSRQHLPSSSLSLSGGSVTLNL